MAVDNVMAGKLTMLAMLALCKENEYKDETLRLIRDDNGHGGGHGTAEILACGLKGEATSGFGAGVMAALDVLEGGDPLKEFHVYIDDVERRCQRTLESAFSREVERYSETGEA